MGCQRSTLALLPATGNWQLGALGIQDAGGDSPRLCSAPGAARLGFGLSVQGQHSEPVVLIAPFQLRTFHDSVNSGKLLLLQAQLQRKQNPP